MLSKLALFTLLLPSALATTSEVIAMGGAGNGANLDWASLTYDESSVVSGKRFVRRPIQPLANPSPPRRPPPPPAAPRRPLPPPQLRM
jgi:hypothetical protein